MNGTTGPLVSVCMITYNHGPYIRQAIEGVLMQRCTFPFELVIGEDCSRDDTVNICMEYASSHPGVRLLPHDSNLGMLPNFFRTMEACTGKYIAFCEGDDYWSDMDKLQKQYDFLESNPSYGMVCTDYSRYFQNSGVLRRQCFNTARYPDEVSFADYLTDMSTIGTATVMAGKEHISRYLAETDQATRTRFYVGDSPLWLFIAATSRIAVLPYETAVYRILDSSACHISSDEEHYRFVQNGLDTAEYFLTRYGGNNERLRRELEQKRLKSRLFYAFNTMDPVLAKSTHQELRKYNTGIRRRLWSRMMVAGSQGRTVNRLFMFFLKQLRQGFGLRSSRG